MQEGSPNSVTTPSLSRLHLHRNSLDVCTKKKATTTHTRSFSPSRPFLYHTRYPTVCASQVCGWGGKEGGDVGLVYCVLTRLVTYLFLVQTAQNTHLVSRFVMPGVCVCITPLFLISRESGQNLEAAWPLLVFTRNFSFANLFIPPPFSPSPPPSPPPRIRSCTTGMSTGVPCSVPFATLSTFRDIRNFFFCCLKLVYTYEKSLQLLDASNLRKVIKKKKRN